MRPEGGPEFFPSDDMISGQHGTIIIPPNAMQTSTLWSEAMRLHLRARRSGETAVAGYERNPDTQMPEKHVHHVLIAEGVAGFAGPALVDVAA